MLCQHGSARVTKYTYLRLFLISTPYSHIHTCRMAPYQVMLNDGRLIFAPQDTDNVIKLRPPRAEDDLSPPSPDLAELLAQNAAEEEGYEEEDGMEGGAVEGEVVEG